MSAQPWETSSAQGHAAVTPSDDTTTALKVPFRALYIGTTGGGNIKVRDMQGNSVAYKVFAGVKLEIVGDLVLATGTDCMNIVAWF